MASLRSALSPLRSELASLASTSSRILPPSRRLLTRRYESPIVAPPSTPSAPSPASSRRPFSSSLSRRSDAYPDAPPDYSRPQSSKSHTPWYRSPTTLVLGFIPVFTFGLGYWQIKRLKWKVSLIEELEDKLRKEPLTLPKNINLDVLPEFDFRLVRLRGKFDHSRTMFLGPRVREGVLGFNVVCPMHRAEGGGMVLVNRGFVSEKNIIGTGAERRLKDEAMPEGEVEFVALLPRIYPPNTFTPPSEPQTKSWYHADPNEMAEWASAQVGSSALSLDKSAAVVETDHYTPSAGVAESVRSMLGGRDATASRRSQRVLPVLLEEVFDGNVGEASARIEAGVPVGRAATIELRNQHAVYAATWFSLSACTAVMFGLLVRRGR
ncbi:surf-like protein [Thecaphora frezii]